MQDEDIGELFEGLAVMINESPLSHASKRAIVCKLLVLLSINDIDKPEFLTQIGYAWEFEKFFQPDSNEIH